MAGSEQLLFSSIAHHAFKFTLVLNTARNPAAPQLANSYNAVMPPHLDSWQLMELMHECHVSPAAPTCCTHPVSAAHLDYTLLQ